MLSLMLSFTSLSLCQCLPVLPPLTSSILAYGVLYGIMDYGTKREKNESAREKAKTPVCITGPLSSVLSPLTFHTQLQSLSWVFEGKPLTAPKKCLRKKKTKKKHINLRWQWIRSLPRENWVWGWNTPTHIHTLMHNLHTHTNLELSSGDKSVLTTYLWLYSEINTGIY